MTLVQADPDAAGIGISSKAEVSPQQFDLATSTGVTLLNFNIYNHLYHPHHRLSQSFSCPSPEPQKAKLGCIRLVQADQRTRVYINTYREDQINVLYNYHTHLALDVIHANASPSSSRLFVKRWPQSFEVFVRSST
jgi:hypothetical protein